MRSEMKERAGEYAGLVTWSLGGRGRKVKQRMKENVRCEDECGLEREEENGRGRARAKGGDVTGD